MNQNTPFMEEENQEDTKVLASEKKASAFDEIRSFIVTTAIYLTIFLVIIHFVARPVVVEGVSMQNTCQNGDYIIIWQAGYKPQKGDIVVIDDDNALGKRLVKRVIALGGDHVEIDNGALKINGEFQEEKYTKEPQWGKGETFDLIVPQNEVFVMGDNRNDSADSRVIGTLSVHSVMGKAVVRLFPFDRMGTLD